MPGEFEQVGRLSRASNDVPCDIQLVASFAAVRLAGCQRHSRTCDAGWIVAEIAAIGLSKRIIYSGSQMELARQFMARCAIDELRALR